MRLHNPDYIGCKTNSLVMKKILLLGVLGSLYLPIAAKAQLQKDTKYVGATLHFNGSNTRHNSEDLNGSSKSNSLALFPSFQYGKIVHDNVMFGVGIGGDISFYTLTSNSFPVDKWKLSDQKFSLSPFVRHYKPLSPKWAVFIQTALDLSYLHYRSSNAGVTDKENGWGAGVRVNPGVSYWISPRFALESDINLLSLGLSYQKFMGSDRVNFNSVATSNLNSYFSVRASWYLQKPQ